MLRLRPFGADSRFGAGSALNGSSASDLFLPKVSKVGLCWTSQLESSISHLDGVNSARR